MNADGEGSSAFIANIQFIGEMKEKFNDRCRRNAISFLTSNSFESVLSIQYALDYGSNCWFQFDSCNYDCTFWQIFSTFLVHVVAIIESNSYVFVCCYRINIYRKSQCVSKIMIKQELCSRMLTVILYMNVYCTMNWIFYGDPTIGRYSFHNEPPMLKLLFQSFLWNPLTSGFVFDL